MKERCNVTVSWKTCLRHGSEEYVFFSVCLCTCGLIGLIQDGISKTPAGDALGVPWDAVVSLAIQKLELMVKL